MENQRLRVGQQFEVVEVLTDGGYPSDVFKVGGYALHFKEFESGGGKTLCNGFGNTNAIINIKYGCDCVHMFNHEVKPVGRLTVTAIHDCESKIK